MRAVRPFLFGGLSSRTTLAAFAKRKRPSVGRYFQRQRVSPAPPRHCARIVPVFVPTKPLARRRGVLGLLSRPNNGSTTTAPTPRGLCEKSPNLAAELPLLGHWRAPSGRPRCGRLPSLSLGSPRRGGVGVVRSVPPTAASGTSTPAPDCSCLARPQSCPCVCHRARVAVLMCVRLAVNVCFALPTDSPRMTGATRSAKPPKSERGAFQLSKLAEKLPRSVFRLRRASPPKLGHCPCGARRAVARVGGVARGGDAEAL